jgi:autotransporter-associated beta strand protein
VAQKDEASAMGCGLCNRGHSCSLIITLAASFVLLLALSVRGGTRLWDGGGTNGFWSNTANWSMNVAPEPGDDLIFGSALRPSNTNNFPAGTEFGCITFAASNYTIHGNPVRLTDGIGVGLRPSAAVFHPDIASGTNLVFRVGASSSLTLAGDFDLNRYTAFFDVDGVATVTGSIARTQAVSGISGVVKSGAGTLRLSGTNAYHERTEVDGGTLQVDGALLISLVIVFAESTLTGTGSIWSFRAGSGGIVRPGSDSPGILTVTQAVTFFSNSCYAPRLNNLSPGGGHDQLNVLGSVDLGGCNLNPTLGFVPRLGDSFVIINNGGADAVVGTFAGLPEGATFPLGGFLFQMTYAGGTGNDVVLTRVAAPPSRLDSLVALTEDAADLRGSGLPGLTYTLEASTDLRSWLLIGPATTDSDGLYEFIDPEAPVFTRRFYRVLSP